MDIFGTLNTIKGAWDKTGDALEFVNNLGKESDPENQASMLASAAHTILPSVISFFGLNMLGMEWWQNMLVTAAAPFVWNYAKNNLPRITSLFNSKADDVERAPETVVTPALTLGIP